MTHSIRCPRVVRELEAEVGEVARAGRELQQAEEASLGDDQVSGGEEVSGVHHTFYVL